MGLFVMPSLGSDMESGTLSEWLVQPGDTVARGESVAVVETHKGAIEVECFETGRVDRLLAQPGQTLAVGTPLAVILAEGEEMPEEVPDGTGPARQAAVSGAISREMSSPASQPDGASPAARRRAEELGLSLETVTGSGPGGAIVLADVERDAPQPRRADETMRQTIAAAMERSKRTIPHFQLSQTIDLQPATEWLAARNADRPPERRVLMTGLFLRGVVRAAQQVNGLNGWYVDGAFKRAERVIPGLVVALRGGGLVAPGLIGAQDMTLDQTMDALRDLVIRARAGRLKSSEMTQATITLSALGETGADSMTGVIFPPQAAIAAMGAPQTRPWVVDGRVVPRSVVTLTVSADHRVADGRQVSRFIAAFAATMSAPDAV